MKLTKKMEIYVNSNIQSIRLESMWDVTSWWGSASQVDSPDWAGAQGLPSDGKSWWVQAGTGAACVGAGGGCVIWAPTRWQWGECQQRAL